ncbi:ComEC/Rec2 family competence protein [Leptolyngbya sp. BC1307]|uniref:ComEC/Rec2 family competence protein n=1 Tax=Leptolyngbya sp. BC1307 TaxID=2029589 RepID=UPI000EFB321F|nr:ComEC/Rec2 family competence protein [Leptolyngbya sp. BC1307]
MTHWGVLVISWAYLLGLLATGITDVRVSGVSVVGCAILLLGIFSGCVVPRFWRLGPTARQWWIAGLIALVGASYCIGRSPHPAPNDVSRFVSRQEQWVLGQVIDMPQTTRQQKERFFLQAQSIRGVGEQSFSEIPRSVSGKLYVTATPSEKREPLYPGQFVELKGEIYALDDGRDADKSSFGDYLAKQRCFAGFRTHWVEVSPNQTPPRWAPWRLRQRIVNAQGHWLKESDETETAGRLMSAMTLGRRAVDLPYEIRDSFIQAGLAHTLAASGFHVSLILGLVLGALRSRRPQTQAIAGFISLAIYVGLTGLQPSVVRAAVMGAGALTGLALQRKVKPLGCLLVAVNLILLCNPQWIWDVGFQLSAMATLGLILTVPKLMEWLDWLPVNVATVLAVPMAAYFWTIPLQLYYFEVLPSYSILLNMIATPLVVLISMGGFVSAIAAIIWPVGGSAIAANLYYPIHLLIWLVEKFNQLPGNSVAFEGFTAAHVVASYGVYAAICIWLWRRQKVDSAIDLAQISR